MDHARGDYCWTCTRIKSNKRDDGDEQTFFLFFLFFHLICFCLFVLLLQLRRVTQTSPHNNTIVVVIIVPHALRSISLSRARARWGAQLRGVENVRFLTVAAAHQKGPSRKNIGI
jgi:hypothetical protein